MVLHLIQRSPYQHSALSDCLKLCADEDTILLMEDAVLGQSHDLLSEVNNSVYVLEDDLNARGLALKQTFTSCSYSEFVALCSKFPKVISWF